MTTTTAMSNMVQIQDEKKNNDERVSRGESHAQQPAKIIICGAGLVGLTLALSIYEHLRIRPELYEQCPEFQDDVGAGLGMYPNGLRVIRDISPSLLQSIKEVACEQSKRRWERHDGTELASAEEDVLTMNHEKTEKDEDLQPLGIRRWRLQKVLYDAVKEAGIPVYFGKRTVSMQEEDKEGTNLTTVFFEDGTMRQTKLLFAADGSKSKLRQIVLDNENNSKCGEAAVAAANTNPQSSELQYTGVQCLMGISKQHPQKDILITTSSTTKCHGVFFPTGQTETCFQFYFPTPAHLSNEGSWNTLTSKLGVEECHKLAERLKDDGWDEKYIGMLHTANNFVEIGFCLLDQNLSKWVYGKHNNIILVGDAAHPPVPYIGQGLQPGLEDVGTIVHLLQAFCSVDHDGNEEGELNLSNLSRATRIYEQMRVPRAKEILSQSKLMGHMQLKRSHCERYDQVKVQMIQREVFFHESLPIMFPGAMYDYRKAVKEVLDGEVIVPVMPVLLEEREE